MNLASTIHNRIPIPIETIPTIGHRGVLYSSQCIDTESKARASVIVGVENEKHVVVIVQVPRVTPHLVGDQSGDV